MKKVCTLALMAFAMIFANDAVAQEFSGLDKSPADIASYPPGGRDSNKAIRVIYSRPQLKGRSMAELAPTGKVWRTGANEATEITFYSDVSFGGKNIPAGDYSLFTIPGENEWTVILNKNLNQWGAYSYDESADVARIDVPAKSDSESLEPFSIAFEEADGGVHMVMGWDKTRVAVPIEMQKM
ncbi:MAG: DUF2911 domain-containing protein [Pricia sp.]|nr:DUF2911 domain-containing protein [Pricia sp.]